MRIISSALLAAVFSFGVSHAFAVEVRCADREAMLSLLTKKFSERPVAIGTVNQDRYMQLFVSPKGTWTVLMTEADGNACILAAGENWESLPQLAEMEPAA